MYVFDNKIKKGVLTALKTDRTIPDIAHEWCVAESTVSRWKKEAGLTRVYGKPKPRKYHEGCFYNENNKAKVFQYLAKDRTRAWIMKKTGVPSGTLSRWIRGKEVAKKPASLWKRICSFLDDLRP